MKNEETKKVIKEELSADFHLETALLKVYFQKHK